MKHNFYSNFPIQITFLSHFVLYFIDRLQVFNHHFDDMNLEQQHMVFQNLVVRFLKHSGKITDYDGTFCKIFLLLDGLEICKLCLNL